MQLGRLLCAHLSVSIKILGRKTEGNESFPGRSLSSFIPIILFVQEEYKGKHSFHQIKGEEKEGGIFNFCLTSLLQSKFSKSGKEKYSGSVSKARGPSLLQVLEEWNGKCIYIYLNFSWVSNPLAHQFSALFCYTCKLEVLPSD